MIQAINDKARLAALTLGASAFLGACGPQETTDDLTELRTSAVLASNSLIATATLDRPTDFTPFTDTLENGLSQNVLGGIGSGLTWAGGTTFLGVPDRGPNATPYAGGGPIDNTASFIARFETLDLALSPAPTGSALPFLLTPALQATGLFYSEGALIYGNTAGVPSGVPVDNGPGKFYFTGRADNFGGGLSTNPDFGRFDPEAIRVSRDGKSVFVADEYGPYVYQFSRATGKRLRSYQLPGYFAVPNLNSTGALEISGNTIGRVTNKGAEGLAITPDGKTLVLLMQSPLIQDGGDGGRANRLVTIDVDSGATKQYVYDNRIGSKNYNSSEIIALNDHQFLIDTRDGKGLGDGSVAVIKQLWAVDIAGATDIGPLNIQGEAALLAYAAPKKLFLDIVSVLVANGVATNQIPAKIEGLAFGQDVVNNGVTTHTLYVANDNDFLPAVAGPNRWYVFGFTDADLAALGLGYTPQQITERGADLTLSKAASARTVVTGSEVYFNLAVYNTGLVPASNVVVTDTLPAGLTYKACLPVGSCAPIASGATFSFGTIAAGGVGNGRVGTKVNCDVADGTVIVNQAVASLPVTDPTPANNASSASITAVNPAPVIGGVAVDQPVLWPPNQQFQTVAVSYGVTDNCAGTICALSVTSNEGSAADWAVVDAHTVSLRADRDGAGSGRVYTIGISCKDSGGAVSTQSASVVVPHNQ